MGERLSTRIRGKAARRALNAGFFLIMTLEMTLESAAPAAITAIAAPAWDPLVNDSFIDRMQALASALARDWSNILAKILAKHGAPP